MDLTMTPKPSCHPQSLPLLRLSLREPRTTTSSIQQARLRHLAQPRIQWRTRKGMTQKPTGINKDDMPQSRGPRLDFEVVPPVSTGEPLETSRSACEPPGQDVRAFLELLPPGWVQNQGFTKGLHPSADVFDDCHNEDYGTNQDDDMAQLVNAARTEGSADKDQRGTPRSHSRSQDDAEQQECALQHSACDNRGDTAKGDPAVLELGGEPLCENRAPASPRSPPRSHGEADPEAPTSPASPGHEEDDDDGNPRQAEAPLPEDAAAPAPDEVGVPEPAGPPPRLSEAQRARPHQLLGQRDADGRVVYNLDQYRTDQERWDAYRRAACEEYRAYRKRKRADGTWEKDDHRWRPSHSGPVLRVPPERPPLPRSRDRSPLPRRRTSSM